MFSVQNLSKSFAIETIFENVSFSLNPGECLGLVGPNGCGKTTLLRILVREEKADTGVVHFPPNLRLGYLAQGLSPDPEETVQSYIARQEGDLPALTARVEELAAALAARPDQPALQSEYDTVLAGMEQAAESAGRAPGVLAALGLGEVSGDLKVAYLSGGQKTRLALASILISGPQLLLLDEPTNHLDLEMLEWLEDWLLNFRSRSNGAVLLVSHDRTFLDHTATGILEMDDRTHRLKAYAGNYSDYLEQKQSETDRQLQEYSDQQVEIARLRGASAHLRDIARFRKGGKADSGDKFAKGFFANRGLETIGRAKQIERRIEHLLTDERVDKPRASWQMKIDFGEIPSSGRDVVVLENLSVGYGEHVLLRDLNLTLRYGRRTALIGPNGTGKTTLLRTIAGLIEPLAGRARLGSNVKAGYMAQEQENLDPNLNALETIQWTAPFSETEARSFLSKFLFKGDDVFTPAGRLSYGERSRLTLACLVAQGCNLLLLDEPVNHLDIPARTRFEQSLTAFDGTVLAVVHDRYFIQGFANEIWAVEGEGVVIREQR